MLRFRKNSRLAVLVGGLTATFAQAGIILDSGVALPPGPPHAMRSIILVPGVGMQPETSYLIQRSQAWRVHRHSDPKSGALLVYPPALGGVGTPSTIRELSVRNNLSRANAYRLEYFRK